MRSIVSPLRGLGIGSLGGGGGAFVPDFYVDSVNGSDSNDGLTALTAFQTLSKARTEVLARGSGTNLALVSGSDWREALNFGATTGITVGVVGTGSPPIIRCTDIATGWTQPDAVNFPNVWYLPNWISESIANNFLLAVYEDSIELVNLTSDLATLNATPGRTLITTSPDGNDILYLHTSDSGNPNTNGKLYEASKRQAAIYTATSTNGYNLSVLGPVLGYNASSSAGAFISTSVINYNRIASVDSRRGCYLAQGTVTDCIFRGSTPRRNAGDSNLAVFFTTIPGTFPGSVVRTGFLVGDNPDKTGYEDVAGLFSHNDQPGVTHSCTATQCWFVGLASAGGFRGTGISYTAPYIKNSGPFNLTTGTTPADPPVTYGLMSGGIANAGLASWDAKHSFYHSCSYDNKPIRIANGFEIHNCVWISTNGSTGCMQPISTGINNLDLRNSIFLSINANALPLVDLNTNTGYTGDYNIFGTFRADFRIRCRYNGVTYQTLAAWQTATGQDANSAYILPADQTIGGANALFLAWAEASSGTLADHGPAQGDFRINPDARVYSSADVAYIGEFPDGTPLVANVGPQFHWDWNTRGVVAGPPTRWPVVPESEADQAAYIADPAAWDFYP
jgi:hypothetical protein